MKHLLFLTSLFFLKLFSMTVTAQAAPVDVSYNDVPVLKQECKWGCWAAATAMLYKRKYPVPISTIKDVVGSAGQKFKTIYDKCLQYPDDDVGGLSNSEWVDYLGSLGFVGLSPVNPSIEGWGKLLKEKGPLIVVIALGAAGGPKHAVIIYGMKGDGTATGTKVALIDPATGQKLNPTWAALIGMYEGAVNWNNQIVFLP